MEEQHKSDLSIKSSDISVKYRGPALYSLVVVCIVGIVLVAIFSEKSSAILPILFLFFGLMKLIDLLAATLGFTTVRKD